MKTGVRENVGCRAFGAGSEEIWVSWVAFDEIERIAQREAGNAEDECCSHFPLLLDFCDCIEQ